MRLAGWPWLKCLAISSFEPVRGTTQRDRLLRVSRSRWLSAHAAASRLRRRGVELRRRACRGDGEAKVPRAVCAKGDLRSRLWLRGGEALKKLSGSGGCCDAGRAEIGGAAPEACAEPLFSRVATVKIELGGATALSGRRPRRGGAM